MSIRYKSLTEKDYSFINIPESFISVLELKKRLIDKEKISMNPDFSFTLMDETGKYIYPDEGKVMKSQTVLYKIGAVSEGEEGILRKISNMGRRQYKRKEVVPAVAPASLLNPIMPTSMPVRIPVNQYVTQSEPVNAPLHTRDEIPPPEYLCPRCYVHGHFEEYCPTINDPEWPSKMKKWNFRQSRGIPIECLVKIDDPNTIALLLKQGNTIVKHPVGNHLCIVKRQKSSGREMLMKKIDTPEIFYCYTDKHIIEDAAILSCCCQIIGCRNHLQDLMNDNNLICPLCKQSLNPKSIKSLPALDRSIQTFIEQSNTLIKAPLSESEKEVSPEPEPEKEKSQSRTPERRDKRSRRDRSRSRYHEHHRGEGMPSGTPIDIFDILPNLNKQGSRSSHDHSRSHSHHNHDRSRSRSHHSHHSHNSHRDSSRSGHSQHRHH